MTNLTDKQIGTLLNLLRKEAKTLGWDEKYHDYNKSEWPARLKQLSRITMVLWAMRVESGALDKPKPKPNTKEQNIAFRKAWDAHIDESQKELS